MKINLVIIKITHKLYKRTMKEKFMEISTKHPMLQTLNIYIAIETSNF